MHNLSDPPCKNNNLTDLNRIIIKNVEDNVVFKLENCIFFCEFFRCFLEAIFHLYMEGYLKLRLQSF